MEEEKPRGSMGGCASPAPPALQRAAETVGLKGGGQEPSTHLCRCVLRKIRVLLCFWCAFCKFIRTRYLAWGLLFTLHPNVCVSTMENFHLLPSRRAAWKSFSEILEMLVTQLCGEQLKPHLTFGSNRTLSKHGCLSHVSLAFSNHSSSLQCILLFLVIEWLLYRCHLLSIIIGNLGGKHFVILFGSEIVPSLFLSFFLKETFWKRFEDWKLCSFDTIDCASSDCF